MRGVNEERGRLLLSELCESETITTDLPEVSLLDEEEVLAERFCTLPIILHLALTQY